MKGYRLQRADNSFYLGANTLQQIFLRIVWRTPEQAHSIKDLLIRRISILT
jgi:hypothetical protein